MHSKEQSKSLLEAVTHYSKSLDEKALAYLEGRGISKGIAEQYSLGLVTDPINGHEHHAGWLSIPYLTALGMCVGVKFRRLDDGKPKYGAPTGQKGHLFNVADITIDSSTIVVCEGELDAVVVSGLIGLPASSSTFHISVMNVLVSGVLLLFRFAYPRKGSESPNAAKSVPSWPNLFRSSSYIKRLQIISTPHPYRV